METNRYVALFDELEKIAEEQKYVTKEKFKRHLKTLVPVGIGTGLGAAGGYALQRAALSRKGKLQELAQKHKATKYVPLVTAAMGGVAAMMRTAKDRKVRNYVEHGNVKPK